MPVRTLNRPRTGAALEPSSRNRFHGASRDFADLAKAAAVWVLTVLSMLVWVVAAAGVAHAESSSTARNDVTDTQNLLGSDLSKVCDEMDRTYQQTGVRVKLLYLAHFGNTKDPEKYVADTLQSMKPGPNTVMLAIASNDGRLVVVVSHGSASWLTNRTNIDKLSEAAFEPIERGQSPDWSGAAIDMMKQICTLKQHDDMVTTLWIAVPLGGLGIALMAVVVVIFLSRHRRLRAHAGSRGRHGSEKRAGSADSKSEKTKTDGHANSTAVSPQRSDGPEERQSDVPEDTSQSVHSDSVAPAEEANEDLAQP